ncbi:hypothetical protein FRACA_380018 [Frankia canadensis]|uniref:Orn/DAP/Arg decarboxylase 2 N-terminal domain-containing protein n=1 Tax=Frankia canadensis TaxID=1836972 RepID=A0A2I2KVX6_9ACTN|nr:hypothetical protein FRACA_380018 [Frankia canadensis]SOU57117.1 hypothetical protein FRACA_380018 [Frankia canadensis]
MGPGGADLRGGQRGRGAPPGTRRARCHGRAAARPWRGGQRLADVGPVRRRPRAGRPPRARRGGRGLTIAGLTWHVGSQQRDPRQWDVALAAAAKVWTGMCEAGLAVSVLNLGGGLPGSYREPAPRSRPTGASSVRRCGVTSAPLISRTWSSSPDAASSPTPA